MESTVEENDSQLNIQSIIAFGLGALFLMAMLSFDQNTGDNLVGRAGDFFSSLVMAKLLGLTAFFFPFFFIYIGLECLKQKDVYHFINESPLYVMSFAFVFFINVYLLNVDFIMESPYAGLFPSFIHGVIINFTGNTKALVPSPGSNLLELFLVLIPGAFLFKKLPRQIRDSIRNWSGKIRMKNLMKMYGDRKALTSNMEIKTNEGINKSSSSSVSDPLFKKISPNEDNEKFNFDINGGSRWFTRIKKGVDGVFSPYDEKPVPEEKPVDRSEEKDNKEEALSDTFKIVRPEEVDIDLTASTVVTGKKRELKKEVDKKGDLPIRTIQIDLEKAPSVFNPGSFFGKAKSGKKVVADMSLLEKQDIHIKDNSLEDFIRTTARKLEETIKTFGIKVEVVQVSTGPVITQYELTIEPGVKISKIVNLADNIALSLAAPSVRIVAPLPGKGVIGIEIPNANRQMVRLREIVESSGFKNSESILPLALGKSILGESVVKDIAATPHLLIAGATGSGKSVCVNSIILSILAKLTPEEIRFIMIDPKMVELNVYNGIPHLLCPVITDAKKAALALRWVIAEMESRYYLLEKYSARSIKSYNDIIRKKKKNKEEIEDDLGTLPYVVVIIDEFADLMMVARKEVEDSVSRLAAMSRAVGIHLILATQRPSVDVITGVIKANFPSRIAFQVSSKIDSRTIIDCNGADQLLGKGDMLYSDASSVPQRIQGAFLTDEEVQKVVDDLKKKGEPDYLEDIFAIGENTDKNAVNEVQDDLFDEAAQIVIQDKKASASYLQRKLKIGYNRAARIIEMMEEMGMVSEADGSKPREVLISHWNGQNG